VILSYSIVVVVLTIAAQVFIFICLNIFFVLFYEYVHVYDVLG